ncbi:hypothetical protein ACJMK2_036765 [Sinanodonta woodiana]|uniref:Metalloendopeptidase n=1 Tax=Sinanodonta woodiana TaxID=1069815 RepID=A0ABD3WLS2_SINWO
MSLVVAVLLSIFLLTNGLPVEIPDEINGSNNSGIVETIHGSPKLNTKHLRLLRGQKLSQLHKPMEGLADVEGTYEADMKLTPSQAVEILEGSKTLDSTGRSKRKVVSNTIYKWPKGTVMFEFSKFNVLPENVKTTVLAAMEYWESVTCLRFRERTAEREKELGHSDFILFSKGPGCSSAIGRMGGPQEVTVSETCNNKVTVAHEIGHSIGFYHEQSRPDRDYFVDILRTNIKTGYEDDFKKYESGTEIGVHEPYDIGSAMHYGPTWFSKDEKSHTIEPKDKGLMGVMGQRDELSFMDIKTANDFYKCNEGCTSSLECKNGGYIGPNCACICPPGLTGRTCDDVKRGTPGCGAILSGSSGTFTTPNFPSSYPDNADCYWLIQVPQTSEITVTFENFEMEDDETCYYDWLEIRKYSLLLAGPKFCGNGPSGPIVFTGQSLMLHFHTDDGYGFKGFRASYTVQPK